MILDYQTNRIADVTAVSVISSLADPVYYFWFLDGQYQGRTTAPRRSFQVPPGQQARVEVVDSNDPDFDPSAADVSRFPAQKTLWWVRSPDPDVDHYRVDQAVCAPLAPGVSGSWSSLLPMPFRGRSLAYAALGVAAALPYQWTYQFLTARLVDLALYKWRIVAVDAAGDDGAALALGPEVFVRVPDAPAFSIALDPAGCVVLSP